jgi:hypothetical protein
MSKVRRVLKIRKVLKVSLRCIQNDYKFFQDLSVFCRLGPSLHLFRTITNAIPSMLQCLDPKSLYP